MKIRTYELRHIAQFELIPAQEYQVNLIIEELKEANEMIRLKKNRGYVEILNRVHHITHFCPVPIFCNRITDVEKKGEPKWEVINGLEYVAIMRAIYNKTVQLIDALPAYDVVCNSEFAIYLPDETTNETKHAKKLDIYNFINTAALAAYYGD